MRVGSEDSFPESSSILPSTMWILGIGFRLSDTNSKHFFLLSNLFQCEIYPFSSTALSQMPRQYPACGR